MPSPFPGMDPYLEIPWLWPDVHNQLISTARGLLTPQLRPKYVARLEHRIYVATDDDPEKTLYYPDLRVARRGANGHGKTRAGKKPRPGAGTEPVVITTVSGEEMREARIEIRGAGDGEVVTVIEFLSPTNKLPGSVGRDVFLKKKREILASSAHWCEIDLLRAGARPAFDDVLTPHEYLVHVSPADLRPKGHVWPIRLQDRLPKITLPLRGSDPPVLLDLQAALDTAYDAGAYDMSVDYRKRPTPPLRPSLSEWADALLKKKKLR